MIIALDSSINNCGFAIVDLVGKVIRSGVIVTQGQGNERLLRLYNDIMTLLEGPSGVKIGVVETTAGFSYAKRTSFFTGKSLNSKSLQIQNRAIGVILLAFIQKGLPIYEVEATEWKQGRSKQLDQVIARAHVKRKVSTDEADAICLAIWFRERYLSKNRQVKNIVENWNKIIQNE